ncbi:MAG: pyridoxamine 5-phosphate oxidase [Paracoccus sp. (in: a-proteobacteria)]|uniref:pyridoxamine 5-phosphate oxidase n=1 Tax=Paracoccus sp. TaxID=267 RepID=UPI0026E10963|nr:pyridoxamine 5-phosphate oxidase [Paracoccus sp. (in: a-proteobacteria)]MDO5622055.1 pyridoxamine 5-phosphate oxidase [Paracoccus sp. (in: a-proteobacteria)]
MTTALFQPIDAAAQASIKDMLTGMRHATLACHDPAGEGPILSRISAQLGPDGRIYALLAGIAQHSRALTADPRAGLLITHARQGKGDEMVQARLSLQIRATPAEATDVLRQAWLAGDPKATIYANLPDFRFWHLAPVQGVLNSGFGRASQLGPKDLSDALNA